LGTCARTGLSLWGMGIPIPEFYLCVGLRVG